MVSARSADPERTTCILRQHTPQHCAQGCQQAVFLIFREISQRTRKKMLCICNVLSVLRQFKADHALVEMRSSFRHVTLLNQGLERLRHGPACGPQILGHMRRASRKPIGPSKIVQDGALGWVQVAAPRCRSIKARKAIDQFADVWGLVHARVVSSRNNYCNSFDSILLMERQP